MGKKKRVGRRNVQPNLGIFGLVSMTVLTLALFARFEKLMKFFKAAFAIGDFSHSLEFIVGLLRRSSLTGGIVLFTVVVVVLAHDGARAVVADTPERFECNIEESLVVYRPRELNVSKVT